MGDQGKLFDDDILPPTRKQRREDPDAAEHQHIVPEGGAHFAGATYEAEHDQVRLKGKFEKLRLLMLAGNNWRTLESISSTLQALHEGERFPESSVSADLRALRHKKNGGYKVDRKHISDRKRGLYAYRVRPASDEAPEDRGGAKR